MAMFTIALGVQSLPIVIKLNYEMRLCMIFNLVLFNAYASETTWG